MDLKADKKSLKKLLGMEDEQFRVPHYQRPYSWTFDQVDDLWDDLIENAATGHFLGSLVLATEDESRPQVIDGQQRLTTLMILLSVLRDACVDRGMTREAQRIQTRMIADQFADGDAHFKFKTGSVNWPIFRDFVLREPGDPKRRAPSDLTGFDKHQLDRNAPLLSNMGRMRAHVHDHLDKIDEDGQRVWLVKFIGDLMDRVELVVIEVKKLADAFLLFETLNDRGLQLSAADLLKSHLLGQFSRMYSSEEEVEDAAARWDAMLEDLGANVDVSRFLRHYLLGYNQSVRKDEVFDHFKSLISKRDPDWVLDEVRTMARFYGEFENPGKVAHEPTRRVLSDLQTLRAMTCYVALLPARRYLSETDFIEFARLCEVLTYRYSTVVGLGTNELERKYRDAARTLISSEGAELGAARQILIDAMPDSTTFRVAFGRMRMGTQYLLRYTLGRIEARLESGVEKELKPNNFVHIEHIMPKVLTDEWRAELGPDGIERHAELLNRYGNLTLFYYGLNIPASNKSFAEKRAYYKDSEVLLTKELTEVAQWNAEAIERRQERLAELADEAWPIPGTRSSSNPSTSHVMHHFEQELGELWPSVEPHCREVPPDVVESWSVELSGHLRGHADHGPTALALAQRLELLCQGWADFDAHERRVLAGAIGYFLDPDDAQPDEQVDGLVDDTEVVEAAEKVLQHRSVAGD